MIDVGKLFSAIFHAMTYTYLTNKCGVECTGVITLSNVEHNVQFLRHAMLLQCSQLSDTKGVYALGDTHVQMHNK